MKPEADSSKNFADESMKEPMTITAKYEDGVFKPLETVTINEGTIVEVHVP